jgi:RNA polymerase sigma factor (sigma-70 family)
LRWNGQERVVTTSPAREDLTDAQAIVRSLADPDAFVVVFERHFSLIHRYVRVRAGDVDADDLAAQTFEIAFRRRRDYDSSRDDARPWLFGIAINLLSEHGRHRRRSLTAVTRLLARDGHGAQEVVESSGDGAPDLRRALASVREEDRDLLFLHACLDLTYDECAVALGVAVGTVRSRLHRVRERLRRDLEKNVQLGLEAQR